MRLGRFTSITEVYNWIEQYFQQYNQDITQILENYQLYQTDLTEVTQLLLQTLSIREAFIPDKHVEVTSVDGYAYRNIGGSTGWADIHNGAGTNVDDSASYLGAVIASSVTTPTWASIWRGILLFDTSSIPSNAVITRARLRLCCYVIYKGADWGVKLVIVEANPASNVALATVDYQCLSATPLSSMISLVELYVGQFYEFEIAIEHFDVIDKDGITKLGLRDYQHDCLNQAPSWVASKSCGALFYSADYSTNLAFRPHLLIDYIVPA